MDEIECRSQMHGSWIVTSWISYGSDDEGIPPIQIQEEDEFEFEFEERPKRGTRVRKPRKSAPPPRRPDSPMSKRVRELEF